MEKKVFYIIFSLIFIIGFLNTTRSEITSTNYRMRSWCISSGGEPTESENYNSNSTVGQPSPLMDSLDPPMSNSYDLYPGFWYTQSRGLLPCQDLSSFARAFGTTNLDADYNISCDSERDGDVDGVDLADFLQNYPL